MSAIDLSDIVNDSDLQADVSSFTILRSKNGQWLNGVWSDQKDNIAATATITVATQKELQQLPEGDRVSEGWLFHTMTEIKVTRAANGSIPAGSSDILVWRGERFRVVALADYSRFGYYRALATRMAGD